MNPTLLLPLPGNEAMALALKSSLECAIGRIETRRFPDGETHLKIDGELPGRDVILVCTLDHPDAKVLPLVFAADAARELGTSRIGLVAPYLAYMRQDRRFEPGEAVTSHTFARILSNSFDWLVTIDPHLHRYRSLSELYSIPTRVLHATPLLAEWISKHVERPVLIGPDAESAQWVSTAAAIIGAGFTVLEKTRTGDREVTVIIRDPKELTGRTPVLLDDIVSSGASMLAAIRALGPLEAAPICLAVHGIFAGDAAEQLEKKGAKIVTCNTVPHASNAIDVSNLLASGIVSLLRS